MLFPRIIAERRENIDSDRHTYLLATGGNDSLVKLWLITVCKENMTAEGGIGSSGGNIRYKEKKSFTGHGGNVTCVRFSPMQSEILGSVATDRTARIWSVVSKLLVPPLYLSFLRKQTFRCMTLMNRKRIRVKNEFAGWL